MDPLFSPKDIEEFCAIWRDEFDEELSLDRAQTEADALVRTVHFIYSTAARIEKRKAAGLSCPEDRDGQIRHTEKQMVSNLE